MKQLTDIRDQLLTQIKDSRAWHSAHAWYEALPPRDQLVVRLLGMLMALALVFLVVYAPLIKNQRAAEAALQKNLSTYNLLAENAHRFGGVSPARNGASGPVLSIVTQQAKTAGINLSRYEQDNNDLRVWLERVSFDDTMTWLEQLQARHGIRVSQITIDRSERPGVVDIRATLSQ